MKVMGICSAGGHLTELSQIKDIFNNFFIVSAKRDDTEGIAKYRLGDPETSKIRYIPLFFKQLFIFLKERPNLIISTGAGFTLPMLFIGKLFRRKIIFIESFCMPFELSKTGKIVYKYNLANKFLVQWGDLIEKYPKAEYWGRVL